MNTQQRIARNIGTDRGMAPVYRRTYSIKEEEFLVAMAKNAASARKLLSSLEEIEETGMDLDRFHTELKWLCERTLRQH